MQKMPNSPSIQDCTYQVQRLSWMKGFPRPQSVTDIYGQECEENPGLEALAETLQRISRDQKHAEAIIAECIDTQTACPTPVKLRELAAAVPGVQKPRCQRCGGSGWTEGYELVSRDAETGKPRLMRKIDRNEYMQMAGESVFTGEVRFKRYSADHTPGVVGTDTLAANFVMSIAIRCGCVA